MRTGHVIQLLNDINFTETPCILKINSIHREAMTVKAAF